MSVSVLFGTTSLLAVTTTFEKRGRSLDRLLPAPIPLELLMLAKTAGAIVFGVANAFVPVAMLVTAVFLVFLHGHAANRNGTTPRRCRVSPTTRSLP
jgi:ABC-2 type transport system permease protein